MKLQQLALMMFGSLGLWLMLAGMVTVRPMTFLLGVVVFVAAFGTLRVDAQ